ncbi:putative aminotransferase class I and II family protein [Nemania sp. FL0916]|nr:putative aminotransferase class I and II family protein [Nemania sp. FL0916]
MASLNSDDGVDKAIAKYGISRDAAQKSLQDVPWGPLEKILANLWSPDNPDGLVFLGGGENPLLHEEVATYIRENFTINPSDHLAYSVGPLGSPRLRKALAEFFNTDFKAREHVLPSEVIVLPGVISVLETLSWAICNENEGIIVPVPFYPGFQSSVGERLRGKLVPATFQHVEGYQNLDDVFEPRMNREALEGALRNSEQEGVKVRAVLISNPHNPLGRCYPAETLEEIARFCGRHSLHLICDEVFAMSVYQNPRGTDLASFTSVLSLDLSDYIDQQFVHVAYGMGKDFCANGLRVGALRSKNEGLIAAVSNICINKWVPYLAQDTWAKMLEDRNFLDAFVAKNRKLLRKHCGILTEFLDQHNIPYCANMNAGIFVWVDFGRYLNRESQDSRGSGEPTTKALPSDVRVHQDSENDLTKRFFNSGVMISSGSSYSAEELGWFRISFTVEEQALHVGLQRLLKCLKEIKAEDKSSI